MLCICNQSIAGAHPFLDELERPLVLGHFEQLHGSPLVRSKAAHLADHVPDKLAVLGQTLEKCKGESGRHA